MSATSGFIPYAVEALSAEAAEARGRAFFEQMNLRRTNRLFSGRPVERSLIEWAIRTAGTAPSGAHKQPWHFVVVTDPAIKAQIQAAAEEEERENYERRFPKTWLDDLAPFGTDWHKPFLTLCPYLIVVFQVNYVKDADGEHRKHYYVSESVSLATGLLLAALHQMGLATLTHTPSPMGFLSKILNRPSNEKPFVLIPVGYPSEDAVVPDLQRKPLGAISTWV